MPEQTQFSFNHKEVVTALLKAQGIHDGIWAMQVKFALRAMNVGANDDDLLPTGMMGVMAIQIEKADKVTNISVDAAIVNPRPQAATKQGPKQIGAGETVKAKRLK